MRTNGFGVPIVAFDLDGTLGDYHGHFLAFAAGWLGREVPHKEEINPGLKLWQFLDISEETYRRMKLAFRQGGWKRTMPAYDGVPVISSIVHEAGAELWICTTRPYMRHDSVDEDTQEWLRRNDVSYDGLLYDDVNRKGSKYEELNRQAGDRVAAIFDDLPEMLAEVTGIIGNGGFKNINLIGCRDQPYNRRIPALSLGVQRFYTIASTIDPVREAIRRWRLDNGS